MINDDKPVYEPALFGSATDIQGFINVYKEAFGGKPYGEVYTDEQVRAVWDEHVQHGRIILAKHKSKVIGLGCSIPLKHAPADVQEFLDHCKHLGHLPEDFGPTTARYMSELGVLSDYRRRGVASELVRHRLIDVSHNRTKYYVMRTAEVSSNSRPLYEQAGATVLPVVHHIQDSEQVTENKSQSKSRVYLYGLSADALRHVTTWLEDKQGDVSDDTTNPEEGVA